MQTKKQRTFSKATRLVNEKPSIRKIKRLCNTLKALCRANRNTGEFSHLPVTPKKEWDKTIKKMRKYYKV